MPIDYEALKHFPFEDREHSFTKRDTMLYALGVGLGFDPTDRAQLPFVYEENLTALPTMAVTLALCKPWLHRPDSGVTWSRMLHGEQAIDIHRPLPVEGTLVGETRVEEIVDKGADKGALLYMSRRVTDKATGAPVFTAHQTLFCRADGGFGGKVTQTRPVHEMPERACDISLSLPTMPQQALIYRLCGDTNPLHADPVAAARVGFDRPILHGLCTFGIAGHAILRGVAGYHAERMQRLQARFAAPVFPGETIRTDIWDEGGGRFSFRCIAEERNILVVNNGLAILG